MSEVSVERKSEVIEIVLQEQDDAVKHTPEERWTASRTISPTQRLVSVFVRFMLVVAALVAAGWLAGVPWHWGLVAFYLCSALLGALLYDLPQPLLPRMFMLTLLAGMVSAVIWTAVNIGLV
jgi:hypothetical protein